ncbi:MAG: Ger(x)C family spore germination C-terminal domain-containing protein, partial [Candidatus Gallimonas sp.]
MNAFRKFLKTVPMKIYLLIAAFMLFSFFSNDFMLVDIQKTAIILAAGVDKTDAGYKVTAQIAVPKGSDRTTGGTSSVEVEGEGETVAACFSQIYSKTGWVPKLVFCDLIALGENTGREDILPCLDYFLRSEYMPDSCLLAMCEGTASELLSSHSAIDDVSSIAVQNLFSDAAEKSGKVMRTTLKEFAIGYYGVSKSGYMPLIRMADEEGGEEANGGNNGGGGEEQPQPQKIYDAEQTAVFSGGRVVAVLSPEETFAFALLKGKVFSSAFTVETEGKRLSLNVVKNEGKIDLRVKDFPIAELSVRLTVRLFNRTDPAPILDVAENAVPAAAERAAEELISGYLSSLWQTCKKGGCDLFHLNRILYRASLKKYGTWKDAL